MNADGAKNRQNLSPPRRIVASRASWGGRRRTVIRPVLARRFAGGVSFLAFLLVAAGASIASPLGLPAASHPGVASPPPGSANVFVSATGSDAASNCKRFAAERGFPSERTSVCKSLQRAYALAACGDTVRVAGGNYDGQAISYVPNKDMCSSSTRVHFGAAPGEAVTFDGPLTLQGVRHISLSGAPGSWSVDGGHYGIGVGWSGGGSWPNSCGPGGVAPDDVVIESVKSHWLLAICSGTPAPGVGSISNVIVRNSDIGDNDGCYESSDGAEDTVKLRYTTNFTLAHDYIHDLYWSSNCGPHSDAIQMEGGNENTVITGNTFVRCADDCLFGKPDFGAISGVTVTNNVFGGPANDICDHWDTGGSCGPGAVAIGAGAANCRFVNNSVATAQIDILCSGVDLIASNIFGSSVTFHSHIDCSGSSTTAVYNGSVGSNTCGSHALAHVDPKWPNASPDCGNPSPSPGCKPDMAIGVGSSRVVNRGSPHIGQYTRVAIDGIPRPLGAAADLGAYEAAPWKNCAAMNKQFPHGIGRAGARDATHQTRVKNFKRSTVLYKLAMKYNSRLDSDKDGVACERR